MKTIKVLHLASHVGNIGDLVNHSGMYKLLRDSLYNNQLEITPLEIREFYWKKREFNDDFIDYVNNYDLFIIGGGNFFEFWVSHSRTGCSIDIPIYLLEKIKAPMFFCALGMDNAQGYTTETLKNFHIFFKYLSESDRCFVSLRNDGSYATMQKYFPDILKEKVYQLPDHGFFFQYQQYQTGINKNGNVLALNLAGDMPDIRYKDVPYDKFLKLLIDIFSILVFDYKIHITLIPHIWSDVIVSSDLMVLAGDELRRKHLSVAPYLQGVNGKDITCSYYADANFVIGNRFHSNIIGIALNKPTLGLINYEQIHKLYCELDLMENTVKITDDFLGKIIKLIEEPDAFIKKYPFILNNLYSVSKNIMHEFSLWFEKLA